MSRSSAIIDIDVIRTWLGLPAGSWPPDHYALLGLSPCEANIERIEQSVHDRLMRIRSYQLSHPAQATEAMTRLAKAFDCLTNAERKASYDKANFPHLVPQSRVQTAILDDTVQSKPAPSEPPPAKWWTEPPPGWQQQTNPPPLRQTNGTSQPSGSLGPVEAIAPPPVRTTSADASPTPAPWTNTVPPPVRQQVVNSPSPDPAPVLDATAPPPVRVETPELLPNPATPAPTATEAAQAPAVAAPADAPPVRVQNDSGRFRAVYLSSAAMRDVGSRRDLYERVLWNRRLLRMWMRVGKFLEKPKRRLAKPAEEMELSRLLLAIDDLLQDAPEVLGQPGQPGYRVLVLASQEPIATRFKTLDDMDREALSRDWEAGKRLLQEYRQFLKRKVVGHRYLSFWQRVGAMADGLTAAYWMWAVLGLVLACLLVLVGAYIWPHA